MNESRDASWRPDEPGVIELPSGRRVRGRSLRGVEEGESPDFGLYLGRPTRGLPWEHEWLSWRDFGLPQDAEAFDAAVRQVWDRSAYQRVEVACRGGRGRTGTTLACLAVLDGVDSVDAVSFVRSAYDKRAVETPWQRRFVTTFRG